MTTIAWDGKKTIAADKQMNFCDTPVSATKLVKITYKGKKAVAAGSGEVAQYTPVIDWIKNQRKSQPILEANANFAEYACSEASWDSTSRSMSRSAKYVASFCACSRNLSTASFIISPPHTETPAQVLARCSVLRRLQTQTMDNFRRCNA